MKTFEIVKILTHNIILASNQGKEYILIGKGIGFQMKPGMTVKEEQASNYYIIQDSKKLSDYERMVLDTPERVLLATEKSILLAEQQLEKKFDERIHLSLLDHIRFAVYRLEHQIKVSSFLTEEYHVMYPELYAIATKMVQQLNKILEIELPHSEVGSIVLHLHAALNQEKVSQTAIYAQVIEYALIYLREQLGEQITNNQLAKARLVTHLKFALKRSEHQKELENPLAGVIQQKYPEIYQIANSLSKEIATRFQIQFSESEISYIALHLYHLKS
ncbi:PRD domain-containing protein [Enterococcus sp. LJL98]